MGAFVFRALHNALAGRFWKGHKLTLGLEWT